MTRHAIPSQYQTQRSRTRIRNRFTRLGLHFVFVGSFAMIGGSIRGLNLLLVLAALTISVLIVQWRVCKRITESLSLQRRLPAEVYAEKKFRLRFRLSNNRLMLPVWMLRITDTLGQLDPQDNRPAESAVVHASVGVIPAKKSCTPHCDCVIMRRGRYQFSQMTVATTFPFSLMISRKIIDAPEHLNVFPKLYSLKRGWQRKLLSRTGGSTASAGRSGSSDGEYYGLRNWQSGDSVRQIHWRTTARLELPAVRQFEQQRRFDICILIDGYTDSLSSNPDSSDADFDCELSISVAASLLVAISNSPANRVVLAIAASSTTATVGAGSQTGRIRMLGDLAQLQSTSQTEIARALEDAVTLVGAPQDLIVVSPRSMKAAIADQKTLKPCLNQWTRSGTLRWINVTDTATDELVSLDRRGTVSGDAKPESPPRSSSRKDLRAV